MDAEVQGSGIRDVRLLERAIKERWPIGPETRASVVAKLVAVVEDKEAGARAVTAAARALIAADAQNMEQEKRDAGIPDRIELTGPGGEPIQVEHGLIERIRQRAAMYESPSTAAESQTAS